MTKTPTIIWSCGMIGSGFFKEKESLEASLQIWESRKQLLEERGIDLKMFVSAAELLDDGDFPVIDILRENDPEIILDCPSIGARDIDHYESRLGWPRDIFQKIGDNIYSPRNDFSAIRSMLPALGFDPEILRLSAVGEGGFSVKAGNNIIFAADYTIEEKDCDELREDGFNIYRMLPLTEESAERRRHVPSRYGHGYHIDTELGLAETPDGNMVLVANGQYYHTFKRDVDYLRKSLDAKLCLVENEEEEKNKAVNFINLPNGEILIPRDFEYTIKDLKKYVGASRIHPIETFKYEYNDAQNGGGLRCRTNVID